MEIQNPTYEEQRHGAICAYKALVVEVVSVLSAQGHLGDHVDCRFCRLVETLSGPISRISDPDMAWKAFYGLVVAAAFVFHQEGHRGNHEKCTLCFTARNVEQGADGRPAVAPSYIQWP